MLLKRGIGENSGCIEINKKLVRLRRVARNPIRRGCFGGLGLVPQALKNFVSFCKNDKRVILGLLYFDINECFGNVT